MAGVTDSPMPNIATSRDQRFARIPVDAAQTSFFEGREFRIIRKLDSPVVYRFTAPIDFILSSQAFTITNGEYEFYAWRDDNVTESGSWTGIPVLAKNISSEQMIPPYTSQVTVDSGGAITVADRNAYADFEWLKSSGAARQRVSISAQETQGRYLSAGVYYLEFIGAAEGSYRVEWEERP